MLHPSTLVVCRRPVRWPRPQEPKIDKQVAFLVCESGGKPAAVQTLRDTPCAVVFAMRMDCGRLAAAWDADRPYGAAENR